MNLDPYEDPDETVRQIKAISTIDGNEQRWRRAVAANFENVTSKLVKLDKELALIRQKVLSRQDIAVLVHTEMAGYQIKTEFAVKAIWYIFAALGGGVLTLVLAKVFK